MAISFTNIALLAAISANCLAAIAWLRLRRRFIRQQGQLAGLNRDLDRALRCLNGNKEENEEQSAGFQESLAEASVTVQLRQGGMGGGHETSASGRAAERYRHVATLARHGLSGAEIAGVLNISDIEAEQVVTLVRFAQPVAG